MEQQYLSLVKNIIENGEDREDRTGVGTRALFAQSIRCNLNDGFPILTTKKTFHRGAIEEMLFFIRGQTDSKILEKKGIKIWSGNTSREELDKKGLGNYREGDIGAMYGFQWRHFGAEYDGCEKDYSNQGTDQLKHLIEGLKNDPHSRRHIMTTFNPSAVKDSVLMPCHILCQFYVSNDKKLSCSMYQRSADVGLGVPFNIIGYAFLTHLISCILGYGVGDLILTFGDTHIYKNHIDALKLQTQREPYSLPKFKILNTKDNLEDYQFDDFEIENYNHHPAIKMDMAV